MTIQITQKMKLDRPFATLTKESIAVFHNVRDTRVMIGHINKNGTEYYGVSIYGSVFVGTYLQVWKCIADDWNKNNKTMKAYWRNKTKDLTTEIGVYTK